MILLPLPKKMEEKEGDLLLGLGTMIVMADSCPPGTLVYAQMLREEIKTWTGLELSVSRGTERKGDICLALCEQPGEEKYRLMINEDGVRVLGGSLRALGWGVQTLRQIVRQSASLLPCLEIEDFPDLENRGFYHDVSRGRVQKLDELKKLADVLCLYKMTQLQLYIEHTYLFRDLTELWRDETPLTAQEILELDDYCYERGIELVPSMACFGHLNKLLSTRSFQEYCERSDSVGKPFSFIDRMDHHTLNVSHPGALAFIEGLMEEFMKLFRSDQFNLCGDETFDLGTERSRALADEKGTGVLYVEFISGLFEFLQRKGKTPMFWGDIICRYPELIHKLPEGIICLNWGYLPKQRDAETRILKEAGATQYVCPAARAWNCWICDLAGGFENIVRMCSYARKYGAVGVLNTDWGDYGHINQPVFSIPGLIYGAVFSWGDAGLEFEELNRQISILEFGDPSGRLMGLLSSVNECSVFGWANVVRFVDNTRKGAPQDLILEKFREEDMTRVPERNEQLSGLERELYRISRTMDSSRRGLMGCIYVALSAIRIWNEVGLYLAGIYNGLLYLENEKSGMELAAELESCLYHYKALWRKNSKEADLARISEVFFWYADLLRDDNRKIRGIRASERNKGVGEE